MEREVGGGIGMGNTCKPMAVSFQCMTKSTTNKKKRERETAFSPLYIFASFVKDKVSIGTWIYLWTFYLVPWTYISVFVPIPYCLDDYSFVIYSEVRKLDSSSSVLSKDCFGYSRGFVLCCIDKLGNYLF